MEIDVLKQLDDRIQASLNRIQQLQKENEQLAQRLAESEQRYNQSEQRYNEANARLREHEEARDQIKIRIESILARFDGLDLG
jgi:DNA repair exonuclease SbcCD ATPase subunit